MQIAATGMSPTYSLQSGARPPETAERGPDRDNDGDDGKAAITPNPPSPPPGRGGKIDVTA